MSITLHPQILKPAFIYFAKYPLIDGVINSMFTTNPADAAYQALKAEVQAINPNSLIPEIVNFLFSSNEDKLKASIEDTTGPFMLLDYGQLSCSQDNLKRLNDDFELGIIIARKLKPEEYDMAETLLLHDELLNLMRKVRNQMIEDSKCHPFLKQITFPHQINPWYARELHNATGFSMIFRKTGIDMV